MKFVKEWFKNTCSWAVKQFASWKQCCSIVPNNLVAGWYFFCFSKIHEVQKFHPGLWLCRITTNTDGHLLSTDKWLGTPKGIVFGYGAAKTISCFQLTPMIMLWPPNQLWTLRLVETHTANKSIPKCDNRILKKIPLKHDFSKIYDCHKVDI